MKKLIPIALLFSLSLSSPLLGQSDDAVDAKIPESAAPIPNITVDQPEYIIPPTHPDQKYGTHPRQIFDIWLAPSEHPSPVFLSIHGGGCQPDYCGYNFPGRPIERRSTGRRHGAARPSVGVAEFRARLWL